MQRRPVMSDLAARDRLAFWRDVVCTNLYHVIPDDWPEPETFHAKWDVRDCGPFGLSDVVSTHRKRTRASASIARDGFDAITVQRVLANPVDFSFAAEDVSLQPGDFCIFAMDWRHQATACHGLGLRSLEIPRAVLAPLLAGGGPRGPLKLRGDSPLGALLASGLDAAWAQIPHLGPDLGEAVLQNLSGLVALACGASPEGRNLAGTGARSVRLDAAMAFVTRHLAEPEMSPARAAAALGVSVRYLHKLFEPNGESFAQFVTRRRLEACRAALESPTGAGRSVADIAFGWGFNSLPTFYRAFAAAFDAAPGDVRDASRRVRCAGRDAIGSRNEARGRRQAALMGPSVAPGAMAPAGHGILETRP